MAAISATVALYRALIKKGVLAREALQRLGIGARAERENDGSRIWPKPGGWGAAHASPLAPVLFGNPSSSALPVAPARWRHRYWSRYDDGGEDNRPNVAFPEIASRPEDILRNAFVRNDLGRIGAQLRRLRSARRFSQRTVSELPSSLRLEPPRHPRAVDHEGDPDRQHRRGQHHAHGETMGELLDLRIGLAEEFHRNPSERVSDGG
jgi:hypothetical protein